MSHYRCIVSPSRLANLRARLIGNHLESRMKSLRLSSAQEVGLELRLSRDLDALPYEMQQTLLRIVQDALSNVHRHADASDAKLVIKRFRNVVHLVVTAHWAPETWRFSCRSRYSRNDDSGSAIWRRLSDAKRATARRCMPRCALPTAAALGPIGAKAGGAELLKPTMRVMFWGAFAMAATAAIGKLFGTATVSSGKVLGNLSPTAIAV